MKIALTIATVVFWLVFLLTRFMGDNTDARALAVAFADMFILPFAICATVIAALWWFR